MNSIRTSICMGTPQLEAFTTSFIVIFSSNVHNSAMTFKCSVKFCAQSPAHLFPMHVASLYITVFSALFIIFLVDPWGLARVCFPAPNTLKVHPNHFGLLVAFPHLLLCELLFVECRSVQKFPRFFPLAPISALSLWVNSSFAPCLTYLSVPFSIFWSEGAYVVCGLS